MVDTTERGMVPSHDGLDLCYFKTVFALQLLNRSAADRLGSGPNEEGDIKLHAFYRMIDWHRLVNREVQPPFKPKIVRQSLCDFYKCLPSLHVVVCCCCVIVFTLIW